MIKIETGIKIPKRSAQRVDLNRVKPVNCSPSHLSALMETVPISHKDLSECSGVHTATVFRWLNGSARVPASVIRMLELMLFSPNPFQYIEDDRTV